MASSTTATPSNGSSSENAIYEYMRQFVDYQENGIEFNEISQIRQLDLYLQNCYNRVRELVTKLREEQNSSSTSMNDTQNMLVNALIQAKAIGDKKMQLSQQMLDAAERQAKKLKLAHQKYVESTTQQANPAEPTSNELDSDTDYESETRSMSNKTSTTSLWKRRATTNTNANSTLNLKRKCVANAEHPTDRKKMAQRNANATSQNSASTNGKRIKLNNDSGSTPSDEPTYCLCSQLSYGSMILCDNKACEIKWFHFNCVDLTTKPKGKWFCPNCAKSRKHVSM